MAESTALSRPTSRRGIALVGLAGALLSGIGDVLILGRSCSGRDFDRADGMIPPHIDSDNRWRSLWNGAALPVRRIQAGTVTGYVGIVLQWLALRGIGQTIHAGRERRVAAVAATAFAASGVLTHQCCATVILAYKRATEAALESSDGAPIMPRSDTRLLAVSAAATLSALAVFSASDTAAAHRARSSAPAWWSTVTPFPCVLATLLTFGYLPAPVGGYARPASISIGLMTYFAVTAASGRR